MIELASQAFMIFREIKIKIEAHLSFLEDLKFLISGVQLLAGSMKNFLDYFKANPTDDDQKDIDVIK